MSSRPSIIFPSLEQIDALDINAEYVERAREKLVDRRESNRIRFRVADFFHTDWRQIIAELPEPVLILGNPPWVTNSKLATLQSENVPRKGNFQNHRGLDAITGKANFDISEWMLVRLIEAMHGRTGTLAMLCKASTARKVLTHSWKKRLGLERSAIYRLDAREHFGAAVDAALLVTHFRTGASDRQATVYSDLNGVFVERQIALEDGNLVADVVAYRDCQGLLGEEVIPWRSGIKHDCAKVMELVREGECYRNGFDQWIELEDTYVFPMLKSSHIANGGNGESDRFMLVTQRSTGDDTSTIRTLAPRTWQYLVSHADAFQNRGSSIYKNRPPFAIFGVGDYTFAPWKVAVSGFYKRFSFTVVGPRNDRPVVLDDTAYFLPCASQYQAEFLAKLLNSALAQRFLGAFVFWDSKRPITAELLRRLDLRKLSQELGFRDAFESLWPSKWQELLTWPE